MPEKLDLISTGSCCPHCNGEVLANIKKVYSGVMGNAPPPAISLEFFCRECGTIFKFPPGGQEAGEKLLEQVRAQSTAEHQRAMERQITGR